MKTCKQCNKVYLIGGYKFCFECRMLRKHGKYATYKSPTKRDIRHKMFQDRLRHRQKIFSNLRRDGLTLQKIGEKYGITRERVRQILIV